jgi:general secretion pathway protein A
VIQHGLVYADFLGLAELPFRITPDPRFLWYSHTLREVKAKILHHLQTRKGPVYLFADVGTGKTSIAFLRFVMDEFGVKTDRNYTVLFKHFAQFLLDQYQAGISPVLLVDEAQNVTFDMLKLIHHLFNVSTNTEFLIQVALFGQNELHAKIARDASLRSRTVPASLQNSFLRLEQTFYIMAPSLAQPALPAPARLP